MIEPIYLNMSVESDSEYNLGVDDSTEVSFELGSTISVGSGNLRVATTAEWNADPTLIGKLNVVYVYTDYMTDESGQPVPGFKVGDGLAYLIDLPFNGDIMAQHIDDGTIHVTAEEKAFWNNKVTAFLDAENIENLVLSKE